MNHFVGGKTVEELAADREQLEREAHKAHFHYIPKRKKMNPIKPVWNWMVERLPKLKRNQNVRDTETGRWTQEWRRFFDKKGTTVETDRRRKRD